MQHFLRIICPNSTWGQRFRRLLEEEFPPLPRTSVKLEDIGSFDGWTRWELWARK
jgi:hypothetical protein